MLHYIFKRRSKSRMFQRNSSKATNQNSSLSQKPLSCQKKSSSWTEHHSKKKLPQNTVTKHNDHDNHSSLAITARPPKIFYSKKAQSDHHDVRQPCQVSQVTTKLYAMLANRTKKIITFLLVPPIMLLTGKLIQLAWFSLGKYAKRPRDWLVLSWLDCTCTYYRRLSSSVPWLVVVDCFQLFMAFWLYFPFR